MSKVTVLIFLLLSELAFGQALPKKMKMHKSVKSMKQEIAKQIPIGSKIEDAKRIMQANGFKCQLMEGKNFSEMDYEQLLARHINIDYLYCGKEKGGLICNRQWQVAIVHKNGIVSDVLVSITTSCM